MKNEFSAFDSTHFPGLHNRAIRYYFYIQKGLDVLNSFRNLFLVIFAAYFALKFDSYWLLAGMFAISIIGLAVVGYYATHRANRILDWLNIRFGTFYSIRQYQLQQSILDTLEKIEKKL